MKKYTLMLIATLILCVGLGYCADFPLGYNSIGGTTNNGAGYAVGTGFTLVTPDGYCGQILNISCYIEDQGDGGNIEIGIYNSGWTRIYSSGEIAIANDYLGWYTVEVDNLFLLEGTYYLIASREDADIYNYYDAVTGNSGYYMAAAYPLPATFTPVSWGTNTLSIYAMYNYVPLAGEVSIESTSVGQLVVLLFLLALNVLLIFKGNVPVLNMVVGIVGFALIASSLGGILFPFPWYMTILLALTSMLVVMRAGMSLRGT